MNGIPLQFRYTVAYTGYSHTELSGSQIVGKPCHEAAVYGGHQLQYIVSAASGGIEGQILVVCQTVQVFGGQYKVTGSPKVPEVVT